MDWILKAAIAATVWPCLILIVAKLCGFSRIDVAPLDLGNPYEGL